VPSSAASHADRYPSPARTIASACTMLDGAAGSVWVHTDGITSLAGRAGGTGRTGRAGGAAGRDGPAGRRGGPDTPGPRLDH